MAPSVASPPPKMNKGTTDTTQNHKTLRETALQTNKTNPSQLGDPISLKAETADSEPTSQDRGASSKSSSGSSNSSGFSKASTAKKGIEEVAPAPTGGDRSGNGGTQTLRQKAMQKLDENPSQLGDPVSLKAEKADSEPTDQDRGAGKSKL